MAGAFKRKAVRATSRGPGESKKAEGRRTCRAPTSAPRTQLS